MNPPRIGLFHPSFRVSGGAEFLIASQVSSLRKAGLDLSLVTMDVDRTRWAGLMEEVAVHTFPKRHWLDLMTPWDRIGKIRRRGAAAEPFLRDCDTIVAYNFPCNDMLGGMDLPGQRLWQCNEPPRGLHMREANPHLAARVDACGGVFPEDATASFATRLAAYDRAMTSPGGLAARRQFDLDRTAGLDGIFAISAFSRDNARRIYGRCMDTPIYPMVRFPEGGRSRRGLDRSGLQVLVHSRLEVLKNIDTVIRGFARFWSGCPGSRLHLVGEGAHRPHLEALAKALLPASAFQFHGFLPEAALREVYAACDVFALLTLDEPFGMVYPEAAAKGLLMVGTDHGGPLEILEGGDQGWVCDPFASEGLAEIFARIWSLDDQDVERRRESADRACRGRFSAEAVTPGLLAVMRG